MSTPSIISAKHVSEYDYELASVGFPCHGCLLHSMSAVPKFDSDGEEVAGARSSQYEFKLSGVLVQPLSAYKDIKLRLDADWLTVIAEQERVAKQLVASRYPRCEFVSRLWNDRLQVKLGPTYPAETAQAFKARNVVKALVRNGGLWVDPVRQKAHVRWFVTGMLKVADAPPAQSVPSDSLFLDDDEATGDAP
jgi:hypothetical protein